MVSSARSARPPRTAAAPVSVVPLRRTVAALAGEPLPALAELTGGNDGALVRLGLGLFRPYLVTRPEHVQRVLVGNAGNYVRGDMLWRPVRHLIGWGLGNEGAVHAASRSRIQPLFSARHVGALVDLMSATVTEAVAALPDVETTVDATVLMTRLVNRTLVRAFFGGRITPTDADTLGEAISVAFTSLNARLLLPFVPDRIPLPGGRSFRRSVRAVDGVVYPLIRQSRDEDTTGTDVVSLLCQARDEHGAGLDDRQVRDDLVAVFVAGSETTAVALTWLWVVLERHPEVARAVQREIDAGPAALPYTRTVLQELLRLYPSGWLIPRTAREADVIDGVPVEAGATVLLSPYLTHRLPDLWPDPKTFDPSRFVPEQVRSRHRFAYFPFGGGVHQCLGSHFFTVQALLIVTALLRRYRITCPAAAQARPSPSVSLRPRHPVRVVLSPRHT